jgi:hypothetical protein
MYMQRDLVHRCLLLGGHLTIDPRLSALNPNADASKSSLASKPSTEEDAHSYSVTGAQRTHGNYACSIVGAHTHRF